MYPILFKVPRLEKSSRLLLLFRPFMMIPLNFWSFFYGAVVQLFVFAAWWVILITGSFPRSMWDFVEKFFRFSVQLNGYSLLLSDRYPPFNGEQDNGYSIRVRVEYPNKLSRLNVLFRMILLLPQFFFGMFYSMMIGFILFLNFWVVLFTGHIPDSFWNLISRYFFWSSRLNGYFLLLVDEYPPFHGRQPQAAEIHFNQL